MFTKSCIYNLCNSCNTRRSRTSPLPAAAPRATPLYTMWFPGAAITAWGVPPWVSYVWLVLHASALVLNVSCAFHYVAAPNIVMFARVSTGAGVASLISFMVGTYCAVSTFPWYAKPSAPGYAEVSLYVDTTITVTMLCWTLSCILVYFAAAPYDARAQAAAPSVAASFERTTYPTSPSPATRRWGEMIRRRLVR